MVERTLTNVFFLSSDPCDLQTGWNGVWDLTETTGHCNEIWKSMKTVNWKCIFHLLLLEIIIVSKLWIGSVLSPGGKLHNNYKTELFFIYDKVHINTQCCENCETKLYKKLQERTNLR